MNDAVLNTKRVAPSESVPFKCTGCAACCRHVKRSVPVEPQDVFRAAKYLRDRDGTIQSTDDFLERYAENVLLDECGFFVFMLKVKGADDACIFLEGECCSIQEAKPRTCRLYPFVASPAKDGRFEYLVSQEHKHHFKGPAVSVKRWMNQYFYPEEREAQHMEYHAVPEIARLLRQVSESNLARALALFWWYRYSNYDLNRPFLEQYPVNLENLQLELRALTAEEKR